MYDDRGPDHLGTMTGGAEAALDAREGIVGSDGHCSAPEGSPAPSGSQAFEKPPPFLKNTKGTRPILSSPRDVSSGCDAEELDECTGAIWHGAPVTNARKIEMSEQGRISRE